MHKILDQSHPPILTASLQKINMKKNNINCNGNEYNLHAVILAASDQILIAEKLKMNAANKIEMINKSLLYCLVIYEPELRRSMAIEHNKHKQLNKHEITNL